MEIREYNKKDEQSWLYCRLLSFYKSSYYDDIIFSKPIYNNEVIDLVAMDGNKVIGFIEIELDSDSQKACYLKGDKGGNIWNVGVHPEYQNKGIASKLLSEAIEIAKAKNIKRFEAWTQNDEASTSWYKKSGFIFHESYLNAYVSEINNKAVVEQLGEIYGVRMLNFEAPIHRKSELKTTCDRIHEVMLYELNF